MPLDAEAICAPAIAEVSTGITLSRDPAVEGQQPASMRRQDLRVDMAVLVWEHMMHKQAAYHWNAYKMECFWGRVWETPPVRPVHILFTPQTTESLGHSLHCSHWRQSRTPGSLTLVSVTTKHKSLHWARNRHLSMVGLLTVSWFGWKNSTWWFLSSSSGFTPWPQWNEMSFFQDPLWAILV